MKSVIILGNGGREKAIKKHIINSPSYDPKTTQVTLVNDPIEVIQGIAPNQVEFIFVGPERFLEDGTVAVLKNNGYKVIAPDSKAAKIETSKHFCRTVLNNLRVHSVHISNPRYMQSTFSRTHIEKFRCAKKSYQSGVVIKRNGLCSGKGVYVEGIDFTTEDQAMNILKRYENEKLVFEEKLEGQEFSFMTLFDGWGGYAHTVPIQDYKRSGDGDTGHQTGGMGCIYPLEFLTEEDIAAVKEMNLKVEQYLWNNIGSARYKGVLYGSFMKLANGDIKVIEYNARFGDPECVTMLHLLKSDFYKVCQDMAKGTLKDDLEFSTQPTVTKYLVPIDYPGPPTYYNQNGHIQATLSKKECDGLVMGDVKDYKLQPVKYQPVRDIDPPEPQFRLTATLGKSRTLSYTASADTLEEAAMQVNQTLDKFKTLRALHVGSSTAPVVRYRKDIGLSRGTAKSAYAKAGVDIEKGDRVVRSIGDLVSKTFTKDVMTRFGDFNGVISISDRQALVASTDGVGTKTILVKEMLGTEGFEILGLDLVHHGINDCLTSGAKPLFFLDYFAADVIDPDAVVNFVTGVSEACTRHNTVLLGGETAEMSDTYRRGKEDLVGTMVGIVDKNDLIKPKELIQRGDILVAVESTGLHTNGYTLVRSIIRSIGGTRYVPQDIKDALTQSHKCYIDDYKVLRSMVDGEIHGMCHNTGGGLVSNFSRILPDGMSLDLDPTSLATYYNQQPVFGWLEKNGKISREEMYKVFNCGIGMVFVVPGKWWSIIQEDDRFGIIGKIV
uniref:phosphoribosylformylglycinamidine cyclo-ligase n=1 Tax=viral metagenome TaxID=1070528 RepID=A0A6C0CK68_9ZZZZ